MHSHLRTRRRFHPLETLLRYNTPRILFERASPNSVMLAQMSKLASTAAGREISADLVNNRDLSQNAICVIMRLARSGWKQREPKLLGYVSALRTGENSYRLMTLCLEDTVLQDSIKLIAHLLEVLRQTLHHGDLTVKILHSYYPAFQLMGFEMTRIIDDTRLEARTEW